MLHALYYLHFNRAKSIRDWPNPKVYHVLTTFSSSFSKVPRASLRGLRRRQRGRPDEGLGQGLPPAGRHPRTSRRHAGARAHLPRALQVKPYILPPFHKKWERLTTIYDDSVAR